jgi:hypothetical protein
VQEIVTPPDRQSGEVSFSNFYPLGENESSVITGAITLLREGLERIEQAITLSHEYDAIGCDDCLQQVVALLPEPVPTKWNNVLIALMFSAVPTTSHTERPTLPMIRSGGSAAVRALDASFISKATRFGTIARSTSLFLSRSSSSMALLIVSDRHFNSPASL